MSVLKKLAIIATVLAMMLLASAVPVLAQQDGSGAVGSDNSSTDNGCVLTPYPNGSNLISCHPNLGNNGTSTMQYSSEPPSVPPGYELEPGGYVCPVFDPHGPPCYRIP